MNLKPQLCICHLRHDQVDYAHPQRIAISLVFLSQNDRHFRYFLVGLAAYRPLCAPFFFLARLAHECVSAGPPAHGHSTSVGVRSERTDCALLIYPCGHSLASRDTLIPRRERHEGVLGSCTVRGKNKFYGRRIDQVHLGTIGQYTRRPAYCMG